MPCYRLDGLIPVVDPDAYVHPAAVLIGDVTVAAGCYVGPGAVLRGDFGRIRLMRGANVQDTCVLHGFPEGLTVVHENGHIGHGAVLHGCTVGADALVGMNAVVMDNAVVGEAAMVAACAFVPAGMQIPARTLAAGTPAKVRRELTREEIERKGEGTRLYQQLARRCLAGLVETEPLPGPGADRAPT